MKNEKPSPDKTNLWARVAIDNMRRSLALADADEEAEILKLLAEDPKRYYLKD